MFHNHDSILVREYASLGQPFVFEVPTTPLKTPPVCIHFNTGLCESLGLNSRELASQTGIQALAGNTAWPGYPSMASVYCGHQFGVFVPQLGDGRALMLAEVRKGRQYRQLQLKGAGPTPFSRHADGRAVLRSSIREYLASEAMHRLGIPSTRALALCASSDPVFRETTETAAVVCRVSESFLRFGHFEYFSYTNQHEALKALLTWHLEQHHPDLDIDQDPALFTKAVLDWLAWVVKQTAVLLAKWQAVGFCHGVMNTDNMSVMGLTIDYGPYGFIDSFDIDHICNHSDSNGRYSYRNQPRIAHWNLYALAQALMPVIQASREQVQSVLDQFAEDFAQHHTSLFSAKLGVSAHHDGSIGLIEQTFEMLHQHRLDFTRFFRSLSQLNPALGAERNFALWQQSEFFPFTLGSPEHIESAKTWLAAWCPLAGLQANTLAQWQQMLEQANPAFVLRNHLLHTAIEQAQKGDFSEVNRLFEALSDPYSTDGKPASYLQAPPQWASQLVLSCSS